MRVLHVVGSPESEVWRSLSRMYAEGVVRPDGVESVFAEVRPGGDWWLGFELDALEPVGTLPRLLDALPDVDVAVPHMFCRAGLTTYRSVFEVGVGVPLVGASSTVSAVAADKLLTRAVAAAAAVAVADAEVLFETRTPHLTPPYVVKPTREDNSTGVTLVRAAEDGPAAVKKAASYGGPVLVESFVPGREIRVAVVELNDALFVPSFMEYGVSDAEPIRTFQHKLQTDPDRAEVSPSDAMSVRCPAVTDGTLTARLRRDAVALHRALGARDFSLFDFRVHADTMEPVLLEAGLFWSFSARSMISQMLRADGRALEPVALEIWTRAAHRRRP